MNAKMTSIMIPVLIFIVTVVVGSFIVLYSLNLDSKKSQEVKETPKEAFVMGVSTEAKEKKEVVDTSNVTPVCESFTNISEDKKDSKDEAKFSFEVVAYETDLIDSIEKVKFSILNSVTNESIKDYVCTLADEESEFEDGSKCINSISKEGSPSKVNSILSNVEFPESGDYFIKAVVESSDGTFSKCAVTKNNE